MDNLKRIVDSSMCIDAVRTLKLNYVIHSDLQSGGQVMRMRSFKKKKRKEEKKQD